MMDEKITKIDPSQSEPLNRHRPSLEVSSTSRPTRHWHRKPATERGDLAELEAEQVKDLRSAFLDFAEYLLENFFLPRECLSLSRPSPSS